MTIMSKQFFNFYLFYSIDYKTEDNKYIFCGVESIKNNKTMIPEFIKLKNISWKSLFSLMCEIKCLWRQKHFNNELTLEFQSLSKLIFSKLKSCEENLNLVEKNKILENEINTDFQTILFEFLYEQQEIYEYYDELFDQKKYLSRNTDIPFSSFVTNYQKLFLDIKQDEKKMKRLKKLRWYLTFDEDNFTTFTASTLFSTYNIEEENENYVENEIDMLNDLNNNINDNFNFGINNKLTPLGVDSFNEKEKDNIYNSFLNNNESLNIKNDLKEFKPFAITSDIINNLLNKEENPVLYTLKLMSITITLFCRETMCFLNTMYNGDNNVELIKEYIKRFSNFVYVAKIINSQCENLNVAINYLDRDIFENYPHFPKFSIFRYFLKIWYTEMGGILTEDNCSLYSKIKKAIIKLFSDYIYEDLTNMKIGNSFQSFLFNSGQSSGISSDIFSKSKGNFNLSTSISLFNSNANNQTVSSTICPFGSYYEDSNIKYTIIEKGLGIIYETFSDEYSVYLFNLSNIETNNYYDDIEKNIIDIMEESIQSMFINNININSNEDCSSQIKTLVDKVTHYFNNYFFSQKIINKMKKRIYMGMSATLKHLIFEYIEIRMNDILLNENSNNNKLNNTIENDLKEIYIKELYQYLSQKKKIKIGFEDMKKIIKKLNVENIFDILENIDNWLEKEMETFEDSDKKVLKELDKNNISSSYNCLQRYLLSFSVKNSWETIRKIRTIENYHQNLNEKEDINIQKNDFLKNSINSYFLNDDLNDLNNLNNINQINGEDINNFDNVDYFGNLNDDLNNNDLINQNNNNNLNNLNTNSACDNLKSSSIFFG